MLAVARVSHVTPAPRPSAAPWPARLTPIIRRGPGTRSGPSLSHSPRPDVTRSGPPSLTGARVTPRDPSHPPRPAVTRRGPSLSPRPESLAAAARVAELEVLNLKFPSHSPRPAAAPSDSPAATRTHSPRPAPESLAAAIAAARRRPPSRRSELLAAARARVIICCPSH